MLCILKHTSFSLSATTAKLNRPLPNSELGKLLKALWLRGLGIGRHERKGIKDISRTFIAFGCHGKADLQLYNAFSLQRLTGSLILFADLPLQESITSW